jgi:hypothetical protein
MHLSGIGVREFAELEVNYYQATQYAVKEKQIHAIPLGINAESALPIHKCEIIAKFQQKFLQVLDESFLKVGFRVIVLEIQKLQNERIAHGFDCRQSLA